MREASMKLLLATFLAMFIFLPSIAAPQVSCFGYGSGIPGAPIISCDGPRGNTLITPLSPSQGIIQGDRDGKSFLEPLYATRIIGQEVWKAEALLTAAGVKEPMAG